MQYAIYASDGIDEYRIGVGRYMQSAIFKFESLDTKNLKAAKLVMITETGHKLDTIYRWPKRQAA